MDQARLISTATFASRMMAAEDKNESSVLSVHLHADGSYAKELWIEGPGCAFAPFRYVDGMKEEGRLFPKMNGKTVFMHAVRRMPECLNEALKYNSMQLNDIDLLVPHQANLRINEAVAKGLGFPETKVFNTIQRFGNTTAATIPIGLSVAIEEGRLKKGMVVGLVAFGSGFTWASALVRW